MGVRRWVHPWGNERVSALEGELRACEAEHVLRRGRLRQERACGESVPIHGEEENGERTFESSSSVET